MSSKILLLIAIFIAFSPLAKAETIKVGVYENPPVIYKDDEGHYSGLAVKLIEYVAEKEGWELEFVFGTWPQSLKRLQEGEIDVLANIAYSEERSEIFDFSEEGIIDNWGVLYSSRENEINTLLDLDGKSIALLKNSIHPKAFLNLLDDFGVDSTSVAIDEYQEGFELLNRGAVDAIVCNRIFGLHIQNDYPNISKTNIIFNNIRNHYAFPKGENKHLAEAIDRNLRKLKEDDSSIYYEGMKEILEVRLLPTIPKWLLWGSLFSVFLVMIFLTNSLYLKHLVKKRTQSLEEEITERLLVEDERVKLQSAIEQSQDAVVITDPMGIIVYVNSAFLNVTGYEQKDVLGKNTSFLKSGVQEDLLYKELWETIRKGETWMGLLVNRKKNGSLFTEDVSISPVFNHSGEIMNYVAVKRDITEKLRLESENKRLEEIMVQNEKMLSLGGLAAGMAHEINNPLAGIVQTANVLSNRLVKRTEMPANIKAAEEAGTSMNAIKDFMETREIPRMLDSLNTTAAKITDIVGNMLSFANKSDKNKTMHDLTALIEKTLSVADSDFNIQKNYDFKTIEIIREYDEELQLVYCEGSKIQQVLFNILQNGSQAMIDAGTEKPILIIRLYYENETQMMVIEIEDNGPGMSDEVRKKIFEPFFTTKPVGVGTGLGLSVSYFIIVKDHDGIMTVESELGKGSKFVIKLPQSQS